MRKSRFSEEQIVGVLNQHAAGGGASVQFVGMTHLRCVAVLGMTRSGGSG